MDEEKLKIALNALVKNIGEIVLLKISSDKIDTAVNLLNRYTREFKENLDGVSDEEGLMKVFNPFVNNVMSVVETLGIPESQFKPVRKLILNELYRTKDNSLKQIILEK
jgi:hypothetical protein